MAQKAAGRQGIYASNNGTYILQLAQNPKLVVRDDPEVV